MDLKGRSCSGIPGRGVLFLCLFALFFPAFCAFAAGKVTARTAGEPFAAGKPVRIILSNGSPESIWSLAKSPAPGDAVRNFEVKNPRDIWDAFFLKSRKGADSDFERAGEIKPGESVTFEWEPSVLEKGESVTPGPGLYRLTVIYQIKRKGKPTVFGTAKTNEFEIK